MVRPDMFYRMVRPPGSLTEVQRLWKRLLGMSFHSLPEMLLRKCFSGCFLGQCIRDSASNYGNNFAEIPANTYLTYDPYHQTIVGTYCVSPTTLADPSLSFYSMILQDGSWTEPTMLSSATTTSLKNTPITAIDPVTGLHDPLDHLSFLL